jgi:hypothetical protein
MQKSGRFGRLFYKSNMPNTAVCDKPKIKQRFCVSDMNANVERRASNEYATRVATFRKPKQTKLRKIVRRS